MTILIFLLVLFVLVLVHEWGHFIVAKKTGMRVDEFGIGFPPKLFGVKKGETEYTFNLFPIGGFVRIYGEDADATVDDDGWNRAFSAKSKWKQAVVLLAGVSMNILFAWFLFSVALGMGVEQGVTEHEASPDAKLVVAEVIPNSPAAVAELPPGAIITDVSIGGEPLRTMTPSAFSAKTAQSDSATLSVTYQYDGTTNETTLTPKRGLVEGADRPAVGIALTLVETVSRPIHIAIYEGFLATLKTLKQIFTFIWNAVQLDAEFSQVRGPVGIVNLVDQVSAFGFVSLLTFTAVISLNLAVINLLPFPALDGGRLLFVLIEAVKGSPIQPRIAQTVNMIGFSILILLMVAVTWNDIARIM